MSNLPDDFEEWATERLASAPEPSPATLRAISRALFGGAAK